MGTPLLFELMPPTGRAASFRAAERAAAAATAQQRAESQAADQMAAAGQEAAAVRQLAASRMPGFVAGVKRLLVLCLRNSAVV